MTAINAMKPFQDVFHVGTTGSKLSVVTSLYAVYATSSSLIRPYNGVYSFMYINRLTRHQSL